MKEKKVLIVTYYWPPSGGGGVQRWLKMVKYLPEFGWKPIVFTPKDPDFEIKDDSLMVDVSPDTQVIKLPIWEPFGLYRKFLGKKAVQKQGIIDRDNKGLLGKAAIWIRSNWFVPDPRVFWVRPTVKEIIKYLSNSSVEVLVTTGPPHSMHLIGMEVKRRTGIKWVADFRDPWTDWDILHKLNPGRKAWKYHKKLEFNVMQNADTVITVSQNLAKRLAKTGGISKVEVITNGYDSADFTNLNKKGPDKFRITFVGLLNEGKNPIFLWETLDKLCLKKEGFKDQLEIVLVGNLEDQIINGIFKYKYLAPCVKVLQYMPHEKIIELYDESAVLLLMINDSNNSDWILPGKMFEYLAANRPIMAFGRRDSDADKLLVECGHKGCLTFENKEEIENRILSLYDTFLKNEYELDAKEINKYERKSLTFELTKILSRISQEV